MLTEQLHKADGEDFSFQSSQLGGRAELGGAVVDFVITNPPGLALRVQGEYWHWGRGSDKIAKDLLQKLQLEDHQFVVIDLLVTHLLRNPRFYVEEALRGIDHSDDLHIQR